MICGARHPNVVVLAYQCEVRCVRESKHRGMHVAAPFGKMITWIEPELTRGAAKLIGDDAAVLSPSDHRTRRRESWWWRFRHWIKWGTT